MANNIDPVKGRVVVTAPTKTNLRTEGEGKRFDVVLSETTKVSSVPVVAQTDSVVLTETIAKMSKSVDASQETSAHTKRLDELRLAIMEGKYEINPDRIAAKMIRDAILLG